MTRGFFVIGGPQAAGKSSSIRYLHSKYCIVPHGSSGFSYSHALDNDYTNLVVLQEMRQVIIHKYNISGAIFMTEEEEREIIDSDLLRMDRILKDGDDRVFLDECNIFTLAHAAAHGIDLESYYNDYNDRLSKLDARVLFLDVSPETSWQRRMPRYEERVQEFPPAERERIMGMYRSYLFALRPALAGVYERICMGKRKIQNDSTAEKTLPEVAATFEDMCEEGGIGLYRRF